MPCSDGGPNYHDDPETIRRLDLATRLLCSLCRRIIKSGRDTLIYGMYGDKELAQWWNEHQEQDRIREAALREEREKKRRMKAALAKLDPEEKRLLGLD